MGARGRCVARPHKREVDRLEGLFADFPYLTLEFELEALDAISLPVFSGSSFRGLLGHSLRAVACAQRTPTGDCAEPEACAYTYLFETRAPAGLCADQGANEVPRPFVLEPPLGFRHVRRGDRFNLGLRLLGAGVNYVAHFVRCLEEMGGRGVGQERARFLLRQARSRTMNAGWICVYDARNGAGRFCSEPEPQLLADASAQVARPMDLRAVELHFLTPTRLVHRSEVVVEPEFHVLLRSLLRRLDMIMRVHGRGPIRMDFRAAIEEAAQCSMASSAVRWFDWERQSERQGRAIRMGGIVGPIRYVGPVGQFMPLLAAGTVTHVGKATTFGMGRYDLRALMAPG